MGWKGIGDAEKQIQQILRMMSSNVGNHPLWRARLYNLSSQFKPLSVPHLVYDTKSDWENFQGLKQTALPQGADHVGGFLIDLHLDVTGYNWRGFPNGHHAAEVKYFESTLHPID